MVKFKCIYNTLENETMREMVVGINFPSLPEDSNLISQELKKHLKGETLKLFNYDRIK